VHIVCVNYFYDSYLHDAEELLNQYITLSGWAEGLVAAGAKVSVVQRFCYDDEVTCKGVRYQFLYDPAKRQGSLFDRAWRVNQAVAALSPDVVHVHGLRFARQAWWLKRMTSAPLLIQDHAGAMPGFRERLTLQPALRCMDAAAFTTMAHAKRWLDASYLRPNMPLFALMEGSSRFRLIDRAIARELTGISGQPACLWVGRLDANKDPITVLHGFAIVLKDMPDATLTMVYGTNPLLPQVCAWLKHHPQVAKRVSLLGCVPHPQLESIYNSADIFLLGSHREGSGYAVLEALSCGVVPIVTDIPSFRVLTDEGRMGGLWPIGDAHALAEALRTWHPQITTETPAKVRAFFEANFSFDAIGKQALAAYTTLVADARRRTG